jgi:hypothetical protein
MAGAELEYRPGLLAALAAVFYNFGQSPLPSIHEMLGSSSAESPTGRHQYPPTVPFPNSLLLSQQETEFKPMNLLGLGLSALDIQNHLYISFLEGSTADVALRVRGSWHAIYNLHRVVLIQSVCHVY